MVLRILKETGTAPSDVLVVGDTVYGIEMGQGGCPTGGVIYGNHTETLLKEEGADIIIDDFAELKKYFCLQVSVD